MAIELTGSVYADEADDSGSLAVTIPADADCCIVIGMAYNGNLGMDDLCWDAGSTNDFTHIVTSPATFNQCVAPRMLSNDGNWPGDGAKDLQWSYSGGATNYGSALCCFFLKNVSESSTVIGTQSSDDAEQTWTSPDLGEVGVEDMCIIAGCSYEDGGIVDVDLNGQTKLGEWGESGANSSGAAYKLNEDQPQVAVGEFAGEIAFALLAAAEAGELSIPVAMYHYRSQQ